MTVLALQPRTSAQATPPKPSTDVLIFTNGDQLTGNLERGVGDSIIFKSDMAGEITVPLSKIKELRSSGSFAVLRKDTPVTKKPVTPGTITVTGDSIEVSSSAGNSTIPMKQLGLIMDQATYIKETGRRSFFSGWDGNVNGGATLVRSTQEGTSFTAGAALVRAMPTVPYLPKRDRTIFDLNETYGKLTQPVIPQTVPPSPPSVAVTSIFHSDAERDEYFTQRLYALIATAFDHNYAQGLQLQQVYGGGIGWTPVQSAKQQLDLRGQIQYEKQAFQTAVSNENLIGATISEAYTRHLPAKLLFTETGNVLPAFNVAKAYSANATATLIFPVFHRFGFNVSTTDNYLNDPAVGFKKNSYQFVTGVTYTLR